MMIVVPVLSGSRSRMNVMLLSLQTRRRRPWRWAWLTCSAMIAPPPWRGRHPRLRPPRRSGSTPVRRLPCIHVRLVTTRQLNCESAVLALLARQRLIHHLLRCHAALVAALQLITEFDRWFYRFFGMFVYVTRSDTDGLSSNRLHLGLSENSVMD